MNNKPNYPDFFDQRLILWSNINLFTKSDYDKLKGHRCICQDTQIVHALNENNKALELIRDSMDIEVEQPIISINTRYENDDDAMTDYYVYPYRNLRYCLGYSGNGVKEWYIDEDGEFRSYEVNYDESCFSLYRVLKSFLTPRDVQYFEEEIIAGNADWTMIKKYTEPIGHIIIDAFVDDESEKGDDNE